MQNGAVDASDTLRPGGSASPQVRIVATACALAGFLVGFRIIILSADLRALGIVDQLLLIARAGFQDIVFVTLLGAISLALIGWRGPRVGRVHLTAVFSAIAVLLLVLGASNILSVRMLGEPLTMSWLKYSDLGNSTNILDSIRHVLTMRAVMTVLLAVAALLALSRLLAVAFHHGLRTRFRSMLLLLPVLLLLISFASTFVSASVVSQGKLTTPMLAFLRSTLASDALVSEFGNMDDDTARALADLVGISPPSPRPEMQPGQIRNVILFILESTPAKYTEGFGGTYPVMPNLLNFAEMGRKFSNVYAHAPASNYFLVSLMAGIVPELSADSMTYNYPGLELEGLGSVLRNQGYRTAFFNSSDNRFQNTSDFVTFAGFDTVLDYRDWECPYGVYESVYAADQFLNTSNDLCTIRPATDWIDAAPQQPFAITIRTGMTHHPYFPGETPQTYSANPDFNRYVNALRIGDEALGLLMDHLTETGLLDSTLVVIVGDHGEAFEEHGTIGHASAIYEENVHVPMVLVNPTLFSGDSSDILAGVSDVGPTVLDLLGIPAPASWQGRSVFDPDRRDTVLFFAPWNGFLIGYRQANMKYIYNANSKESWLFDLATDPEERTNLFVEGAPESERARRLLAALVSDQLLQSARLLEGISDANPELVPASATVSPWGEVVLFLTGTRYQTAPRVEVQLDGQRVGVVELSAAPSNADRIVSDAEIDAAVASYQLDLLDQPCAGQLALKFLNDEWAGENQTGDNDLYIQRLVVNGTTYLPPEFRLETEGAGGIKREYFSLWRNGSVRIDLRVEANCIATGLVGP